MNFISPILLALTLVAACPVGATELFHLSDVRVLSGPLKHAQDVNAEHLLQYNVDRLLAPYRIEAGLAPKAPAYPNWESSGLGGHTAGHYLSALANTYAATGDRRFERRMDYMIDELARCQLEIGTGYVGGIPDGKALWADISRGNIRASGFGLNDRWVPWYNLHKTFAGLRDAHVVGGNAQAGRVLVALADWCLRLTEGLSEAQMQDMLRAEFGGMNEVLADVAQITGEQKYLDLAQRFNHHVLLRPLEERQDRLNGMHANTQVPKVIGFEQIAQMSGDDRQHIAAEFFWETVVGTRTLAFGGNSIAEHFPSPERSKEFATHIEGPETCNTYNMLRLTELLFEHSPEPRYADFYERALFNHILSSQHPVHGGYVYFTPARPQHYRVYSQPGACFWCCVGSGMENHTKYGQFIYAHDADVLYVNLFVDSELSWQSKGATIRQETAFPESSTTTLKIRLATPTPFTLKLRHPAWTAADAFAVMVNGELVLADSEPGSYFTIERRWQTGDVIEVQLPMAIHSEAMPYVPEYQAIMYGPLVLAAATTDRDTLGLIAGSERMDHVAHGAKIPLDESPVLTTHPDTLAEHIQPVVEESLKFRASGIIRPVEYEQLDLVPFYKIHDSRYVMYWRTVEPEDYERMREEMASAEADRIALERMTVDQVAPGQQQPEVEHNFRGEDTSTGIWRDRHFRHAQGWFSYELNTHGQENLKLRLTYFGSDRRRFDILINGQVLESVHLEAPASDQFIDVEYLIDPALLQGRENDLITVMFRAKEGSMAGGIFGVRLIRSD